jgi:hypothetical protein
MLAFTLDRTGKPNGEPVTVARGAMGQFSPDGRWIACTSFESDRPEIYVRPFPGPGAPIPISVDGGGQVRWRANGEELFYIAPDDAIMAVPFRSQSGEPGAPVRLFATRLWGAEARYSPEWDVASDGERFLLKLAEPSTIPISLILRRR